MYIYIYIYMSIYIYICIYIYIYWGGYISKVPACILPGLRNILPKVGVVCCFLLRPLPAHFCTTSPRSALARRISAGPLHVFSPPTPRLFRGMVIIVITFRPAPPTQTRNCDRKLCFSSKQMNKIIRVCVPQYAFSVLSASAADDDSWSPLL